MGCGSATLHTACTSAPGGGVVQRKTKRPVQFEITPETRDALAAWIDSQKLGLDDHPAVGLMPGAEYGPAKQWPAESYGELALSPDGSVLFRVWAPLATRVSLHLLGPDERLIELEAEEHGYFAIRVPAVAPGAR